MFKSIYTIKHWTVRNNTTIDRMARFSFFLSLLFSLDQIFVLIKFEPTSAFPCRSELFAWTVFTGLFIDLMNTIWVFAIAFKILRSINRYVCEISTSASWLLAFYLIILCFQEIMIFKIMITKTFSWWSNNLAL